MKEGILYIVCGETHINEMKGSIAFLRKKYDIPIHVISDYKVDLSIVNYTCSVFPKHGSAKEFKIRHMSHSPFERTLFLDSDVYVFDKLEEVLALLGGFDMAMAHAPYREFLEQKDIPSSFPEYNTGVIAFNRNQIVTNLFSEWLVNFEHLKCERDQPSFRRTLFENRSVRYCTLPPEFNCRFNIPGFVCDKVNFLHGRSANIELVERQINSQFGPRVHLYGKENIWIGNNINDVHKSLMRKLIDYIKIK